MLPSTDRATDGVLGDPSGPPRRGQPHRQDDRRLRWATLAFLVAAVLHNGDHLRRGMDSVTPELQGVGWLGMAVSAVAIVVVLRGHRTAPLVAVAAGVPLALGFTAAHWLPRWSELSDPFLDGDAQVASIVASLLEIAGAVGLAVAGGLALRERGLAATSWTPRRPPTNST